MRYRSLSESLCRDLVRELLANGQSTSRNYTSIRLRGQHVRYRSLSESLCRDLVRELLANGQPLIQGTDQGTGSRVVDWGLIRDTSEWMKGQIETAEWKHRDPTEGRLAIRLHQALDHVDPEVLDDAGFWRYLGLRYFWEVIRWREPHAFKGPDTSEKAIRYVGAIKPIESVLTRMYLRAVALGTSAAQPGDEGRLAYALPAATDFWRSHVTRVRTATAPAARSGVRPSPEARTDDHGSVARVREGDQPHLDERRVERVRRDRGGETARRACPDRPARPGRPK